MILTLIYAIIYFHDDAAMQRLLPVLSYVYYDALALFFIQMVL